MIHNPSKDYFQKLNSINRFFTRTEAQGYIFASAIDQRLIKQINQTLIERAAEKDKTIHLLFIKNTDEWTVMQNIRELQKSEEQVDGIIIGNLDEFIFKNGKALVDEVNFSREAFQALEIPILIWLTKEHLSLFSNRAVDFYTQRERSTVFFDDKVEVERNELLERRFDDDFKTEEEFKALELKIDLLKKQLKEAENGEYSRKRIANGLVLDLIKTYDEVHIYPPALELLEKYKDDILPTIPNYLTIGNLYHSCNKWDKAINIFNIAIELEKENGEKENLDLAILNGTKSLSLRKKGDYSNALKSLLKTIEIEEKNLNHDHPNLAASYDNIAATYRENGNIKNALIFQLKAIEIKEKILDDNHPHLARSYSELASIYNAYGKIEKALKFQLKAIKIFEKALDKNHPNLAASYNNISLVFIEKGDIENALKFQLKSIRIREKALDINHPNLAISYNNMASIYCDIGKYKEAKNYMEKAIQIQKQKLPPNHPHLLSSIQSLKQINQSIENQPKTIKNTLPKIGRNEKITVKYPDGKILKNIKFKTVKDDLESGACELV